MRKFILSLMLMFFVSSIGMASSNLDGVTSLNSEFATENTYEVVDDGFWQCIEMSRTEEYSYFSDTTTVTITYRCWWITF